MFHIEVYFTKNIFQFESRNYYLVNVKYFNCTQDKEQDRNIDCSKIDRLSHEMFYSVD